ncbi:unnamed protein product [Ectocarpus sp. 8 AP-2014]
MIFTGTPYAEVFSVVRGEHGNITDELKGTIQSLRETIADAPDDRLPFNDGEAPAPLDEVMNTPNHEKIDEQDVVKKVVRRPDGFVDKVAMQLMAEHLGLDGLRIVRLVDGLLVPSMEKVRIWLTQMHTCRCTTGMGT